MINQRDMSELHLLISLLSLINNHSRDFLRNLYRDIIIFVLNILKGMILLFLMT
ncbi:hypothetical protein SAMN05216498_2782 [Tenuibacillus multivorans]|uniref:Uncharacterized protein n=1 Tax=Tenuibacillus multivorans TaxID=237069 RepID=A0A1H0DAK8_9BACI|nr:hypothetical protein SAMN05216498_2782 [Tenuibacillus multivorans]